MKYKELSDELNKQFMKEKKTLKKEKIKKGEGTFQRELKCEINILLPCEALISSGFWVAGV